MMAVIKSREIMQNLEGKTLFFVSRRDIKTLRCSEANSVLPESK